MKWEWVIFAFLSYIKIVFQKEKLHQNKEN